jgi:nucleoside-diphosphate-sugar epimerase
MSLNANSEDLLFPKHGLILVTGANGHVASNIVTEALALGFRVRGTVRTQDKIAALERLFNNTNYTSIVVADMATPGAFDEAVQGVDVILVTATKLPGPADPNEIVPETIAGVEGLLKSALASPSVKRVVYTGTIPIAFSPGVAYKQDNTTWATDAVAAAFAPPLYLPGRTFINYKAAKNEAEKAMFEFVKTNSPHFTVNSVLPVAVFGRIITKASEPGEWPREILRGKFPAFGGVGRKSSLIHSPLIFLADIWFLVIGWYINMNDVARLHLAAAFDATVIGQRFIAAAAKFDWNELIDVVQKLAPTAKVAPRLVNPDKNLGENDNAPGAALLKKWWGQEGYVGLEQSIRKNLSADL